MKQSVFESYVMLVQKSMHHAGLYDGAVDGVFGPATVSALPTYAKKFRGLISKKVFESLTPRLQLVALAQCICTRSGMDVGTIDGAFSRKDVR